MTIEQVSDHLQVPVWTLRKWRSAGTGPRSIKVGRHVRYPRAAVDTYIADLIQKAG